MDYNIQHLMEFWELPLDKTLIKIAKIIQKDKDYYLNFYDPIKMVKKRVINNRIYEVEKTLENDSYKKLNISKFSHPSVPRISIKDNKSNVKYLRFSAGFFHQIFGEKMPLYAKIDLIQKEIIKIEFSCIKKDGFLNIFKSSKSSRFYSQLNLNGFLNYYCLKISDLEGVYLANKGFKQDMVDNNIFYLYIDKKE